MTVDISTLVPTVVPPFKSADITFWCVDGDLRAFMQVAGAQKVSFQRVVGKPQILATAHFATEWDPERGICNASAYARLTIEQAREAAQRFADKSFVHDDDELAHELGIQAEKSLA